MVRPRKDFTKKGHTHFSEIVLQKLVKSNLGAGSSGAGGAEKRVSGAFATRVQKSPLRSGHIFDHSAWQELAMRPAIGSILAGGLSAHASLGVFLTNRPGFGHREHTNFRPGP